ncbi:hypothetical protein D3C79_685020 [compost metagenome]
MALTGLKRLQPTQLIDPFRLVREQHRITVKRDPQLIAGGSTRPSGKDRRCSETGLKRATHIVSIGGEEQMTTKGRQVRIRAAPADKGGAIDPQAMMLDRVEHPQAGIGAIARHQHDFNPWLAEMGIEP